MLDIWRGILQFRANFLSLYKIGCGSGKKTSKLFSFRSPCAIFVYKIGCGLSGAFFERGGTNMIRKSIIVMLLGFSVLAMSMPVVAQQRAAVDYVVTSTTSGKGVLVIENNTESVCRFTIYSITGQVVRVLVVKPGNERVELQKGFYIVKSEYGSQKVVVR